MRRIDLGPAARDAQHGQGAYAQYGHLTGDLRDRVEQRPSGHGGQLLEVIDLHSTAEMRGTAVSSSLLKTPHLQLLRVVLGAGHAA